VSVYGHPASLVKYVHACNDVDAKRNFNSSREVILCAYDIHTYVTCNIPNLKPNYVCVEVVYVLM